MSVRTSVQSAELQVVAYPRDRVGPENFELVKVELGAPGPGQVLVRNTCPGPGAPSSTLTSSKLSGPTWSRG